MFMNSEAVNLKGSVNLKSSANLNRKAALALADGTIFWGQAFGAECDVSNAAVGEVVFNTSMFGYQEIITDPSYAGQMLCFTTPHIGNVGCNSADNESDKVHATGVIIRDLSPVVSNFRAEKSLSEYLQRVGIMGLTGIDTRDLVRHLRDVGSQMGAMACGNDVNPSDLVDKARSMGSMLGKEYVTAVTCKEPYTWFEGSWTGTGNSYKAIAEEVLAQRPHVVALDCGIKQNILRLLVDAGFRVTVVPAGYEAAAILALRPDGLFLSNGPGDPATLDFIVANVKELLGRFPIFGICLGHQILAQAVGGKTFKLKFGHRGGNHPVKHIQSGRVEITVQNHGFAVDDKSLPSEAHISHINLNDNTVEGLDISGTKAFSVQYHPEASPGPHDAGYLFREFFEKVVCQSALI